MIVTSMLEHNRGIGYKGDLCVRDPEDMALFKRLTMGRNLVMGRKTAESLPFALLGRGNYVLTRDLTWRRDGFIPLSLHIPDNPIFIGGAEIFERFLPSVEVVHLSTFSRPDLEADIFLPSFEEVFEVADSVRYTNFTHYTFKRINYRD